MTDTQSMSAVIDRVAEDDVSSPQPQSANLRSLKEAFDVFNQKTRKLQESYSTLKKQVEDVNEELRRKNEILKIKIDELDTTRDYLRNILESMSNGLIAVNLRGRITTLNKAAETITGYSREEVLGRRYSEVFPDDGERHDLFERMISGSRGRVHQESILTRKDGKEIPVGLSLSPVQDSDSRVTGAIEIFEDLTEIKQLEEQVRRADRLAAIGEMAASVAHEIRNPLGGIEGFAALLMRDLAGDERKHEMAVNILEGAKVLNRIVSSLLDFTRPMTAFREETRVEEIIENALSLYCQRADMDTSQLTIRRKWLAEKRVHIDRQLMLQVFINLIANAIQAMDGCGVLSLETAMENGNCVIRVSDSGCGIPEDVKEKLFMPFVTTKKEGTGLGLATVLKIIDAHDGAIECGSAVGEGTVFTITLPAMQTQEG